MFTISDNGSIAAMQARIAAIRAEITPTMLEAGTEIGDYVASELGSAAPVGKNEGPPPPGDGPGRLSESFSSEVAGGEGVVTVTVTTSQPTKLGYVVNGRGWVYPVNKQALMWPGLDHPVRSAQPTQPNDFVSPVIETAGEIADEFMQETFDALLATM